MLESLFNKVAGLRAPTKMFSCEYYKIFKDSFFMEHLSAAFDYSNPSKIFREITASKFQGQHATQINRYGLLYPAIKTETYRGFTMEFFEILEKLVSRIILGGCF